MKTPPQNPISLDSRPLPLEANLGRLEPVLQALRPREALDKLFAQVRSERRIGWGSVLPTL